MSTSQLSLYNGALRILGEGKIASLTEDREPRYVLDDIWDDGAVNHCLEEGQWNFAIRTRQASYDPDVTPSFGFQYAFSKPSDWMRTTKISDDEYFTAPLSDSQYNDEAGYWWCDLQTIYVSYVSNDSSYGNDMSLWPQSFVKFVEAYLALHLAPRLRQATVKREEVKEIYKMMRRDALNKDSLNEGAKFRPQGNWSKARGGRGSMDRGNRNRLIG